MITRSQTKQLEPGKKAELPVNIDFDVASKAWRANKKYIGDGSFKYKENARLRAKLQGGRLAHLANAHPHVYK